MNPALPININLQQGDELVILATVAFDVYGTPVTDASGWTLFVTVKWQKSNSDANAIILADGTSQSISGNVVRQAVSTAALRAGTTLYYDARLEDPQGRIFTYQYGVLIVGTPVLDNPDGATPTSPAGAIFGSRPFSFTTQAELLAIATAGHTLNYWIAGTLNGAFVVIQIVAGSQDTGGGYYRPNDYNALTNAVVWQQLL